MAENRTGGKAKGKGCALAKGGAGPVVRSERETTWPGTCGHLIVFTFREARVAELGQTGIDPERARILSFNPWKNNGAHSKDFAEWRVENLFIYRRKISLPTVETVYHAFRNVESKRKRNINFIKSSRKYLKRLTIFYALKKKKGRIVNRRR